MAAAETKKTKSKTPAHPTSSTTRSYLDCYQAFIAEARAVPVEALASSRGDCRLARHNTCRGIEALWSQREVLTRELVTLDTGRLWSLPDLARAGVYAAKLAERKVASTGELAARSTLIATPRTEMLRLAETLSRRGVFPEATVRALSAGKGRIDAAEDVLALVALYCDPAHAQGLAGKHPFTSEEFAQWRAAAEFLVDNMVPATGRKVKRPPTQGERDVLGLWTLLARGYDRARRAGVWIWGESEVDAHMPKLLSRAAPGASLRESGDDGPSDPKP